MLWISNLKELQLEKNIHWKNAYQRAGSTVTKTIFNSAIFATILLAPFTLTLSLWMTIPLWIAKRMVLAQQANLANKSVVASGLTRAPVDPRPQVLDAVSHEGRNAYRGAALDAEKGPYIDLSHRAEPAGLVPPSLTHTSLADGGPGFGISSSDGGGNA